eukprot:1752811-Amphidinium_carterae.1
MCQVEFCGRCVLHQTKNQALYSIACSLRGKVCVCDKLKSAWCPQQFKDESVAILRARVGHDAKRVLTKLEEALMRGMLKTNSVKKRMHLLIGVAAPNPKRDTGNAWTTIDSLQLFLLLCLQAL